MNGRREETELRVCVRERERTCVCVRESVLAAEKWSEWKEKRLALGGRNGEREQVASLYF